MDSPNAVEPQSASARPALFSVAFVLLLVVQLLFGTTYSTLFLFPKYLLETRAADATFVGNAQGIFAIMGAVSVALVGPWLDKWGRRPVMIGGLVLAIFSYAPLGWADSMASILSLRAVHGVSFAMVFGAGSALAVDLAPPARRAEAVGYFGTAMLITNGFGPAIAETLSHVVSWRAVFVSCSLYSLGALCAALRLRESAPHRDAHAVMSYTVPHSWPLAGAYLAAFAVGIGVGVSKTFIPALLVQEGAANVTPQFVLYTVGALLQRTVLGWLPDRLGRLRATVLSLGLYGLVLAAMAPSAIVWIPALALVLGMAHGAAYPSAAALTADLCTQAERGRASAWFAGFFNLGVAVAASGLPHFDHGFGYRGMIGSGALLLGLSALVIPRWVRRGTAPSSSTISVPPH